MKERGLSIYQYGLKIGTKASGEEVISTLFLGM